MDIAARSLKLTLRTLEARAPSELAGAFSAATKERAGALIGLGGSMFFAHRARIAELAAKSHLPAIYPTREFAEVGGLMTYGVNLRESFRRAAGYVDQILKGAKVGDLPIERPTRFELIIDAKAAKALRLTIPSAMLARADQIIE